MLLLISLLSCSQSAQKAQDSSISIGIAEVDYTPSIGLDLVGNYRGDDYASRGVHDPLYARAIVASDSKGEKAAILSVDILKLGKEAVDMMREHISSQTEIKPENIMIHATHTHSGPKSDLDAPEARDYLTKAASAVIEAYHNMKPTVISSGRTEEHEASYVRRLKYEDGKTRMVWEDLDPEKVVAELGSKDPEMITLSFEQDGKKIGAMVNFACHATNLTGSNWLYSADFPGYIAATLKEDKGENFIPMFVNGCCGNVTQVNYKRGCISTYEECERHGNLLGSDALMAMKEETVISTNDIKVSKQMVPLKRISISDEQLAWAKEIMAKVEREGMPPLQQDGIPDATYAMRWIDMRNNQDIVDSLEVMVIGMGDLAFVGLPGEMFAEFGVMIKNASPFKHTLVMGLTNDARAYFPTKEAFTEGPEGFTPMITGYETTPGTTRYEIGAGEKLTASAIEQLKSIF
ncbi:MAG: neutral/alkaline non-lysosomal ceramidase N-terminal domain-containing protein [Dysgonamonadaceae bacterium]|nr:neutral/alkaline non-lysosomal ceramidase N-terminal domain-containing protein [Dysgonamonadaceae bacterium]